jgi:pimeloyl-ACP methyl ester carboxylesterase
MPDIVLIHGFATGLNVSVIRRAKGTDAGFRGFRKLIGRGIAKAFRWDVPEHISFPKAFSPSTYLGVYRREMNAAQDKKTHPALETFLHDEQPRVIVCHSMGCSLLLSYLVQRPLPASVRHIVFVQADVSVSTSLPKPHGVIWHNLYCPWDPTLLLSAILHHDIRAGLARIKSQNTQNRFTPLFGWNPHTSSIRSQKIANWTTTLD